MSTEVSEFKTVKCPCGRQHAFYFDWISFNYKACCKNCVCSTQGRWTYPTTSFSTTDKRVACQIDEQLMYFCSNFSYQPGTVLTEDSFTDWQLDELEEHGRRLNYPYPIDKVYV